jgi:hypothetical protein
MTTDGGISSYSNQTQDAIKAANHLTEIRIAADFDRIYKNTESSVFWHWHPNSPGSQKTLMVILESCNVIYGVGSHWIEERDVSQDRE